jgi:hypothetical protein
MLPRLFLVLAIVVSAWAQRITPTPFSPIPANLRLYLELSNDQVTALTGIAQRFQAFQAAKLVRWAQVRAEIDEESAREVIDPNALGLRYREIELINREIEAERQRNRTELLAALTPTQRTKVTALDQVLRLQNTACSAVSFNLLSLPVPDVVIFDPILPPTSLLGSLTTTGCGSSPLGSFRLP